MTYQIGDECLHCGMCEGECPQLAISLNDGGDYRIDQSLCVGCGSCAALCPTENIHPAG